MDLKTVKELIDLIKDTDIVELEWTVDRIHIVKRGGAPLGQKKGPDERLISVNSTKDRPTITVTSPLVGTFYRSASPETAPFVQIGDRVTKEQCLCIIEAMKLMNEIESHVDGVVTAILKQDGDRVEYGDPLFIIEEA